jgi:nucleoid-associated protein YgaU
MPEPTWTYANGEPLKEPGDDSATSQPDDEGAPRRKRPNFRELRNGLGAKVLPPLRRVSSRAIPFARKAGGKFATLRRETRFGIAALLSFVILVGVLISQRDWKSKGNAQTPTKSESTTQLAQNDVERKTALPLSIGSGKHKDDAPPTDAKETPPANGDVAPPPEVEPKPEPKLEDNPPAVVLPPPAGDPPAAAASSAEAPPPAATPSGPGTPSPAETGRDASAAPASAENAGVEKPSAEPAPTLPIADTNPSTPPPTDPMPAPNSALDAAAPSPPIQAALPEANPPAETPAKPPETPQPPSVAASPPADPEPAPKEEPPLAAPPVQAAPPATTPVQPPEAEPPVKVKEAPPLAEPPSAVESTTPKASAPEPEPGEWVALPKAKKGKFDDEDGPFSTDPSGTMPIGAAAAAAGAAAIVAADENDRVEAVPHVVQRGENFWTISRLYYSSGRYYRALWKANSQLVSAPEKLVVGMTIRIPPPEELDRSLIVSSRAADQAEAKTIISRPRTVRPAASDRRRSEVELALPVTDPSTVRQEREIEDAEPVRETRPPAKHVRYKVRAHETLRSIARDTLGDSRRDEEILELNRKVIDDPRHLVSGQILELPEDAKISRRR